jgi:hypothetical protein
VRIISHASGPFQFVIEKAKGMNNRCRERMKKASPRQLFLVMAHFSKEEAERLRLD